MSFCMMLIVLLGIVSGGWMCLWLGLVFVVCEMSLVLFLGLMLGFLK